MVRDYIAANQAANERLTSLVARLSDDDLQRKFDWGWTVAVALAHVAFFDRRAARLVERFQANGVGPSPYDADAINDAMLPAWLLIPPRAAANEALAAAAEVDNAVADLSDELLAQCLEGGSINPNRAWHRNMHLDEIESLLG